MSHNPLEVKQNEFDALQINKAGWRQGSVFVLPDLDLPFEFDASSECLIITTQSCSVVSPRFETDPFVEAMAVRKLSKFNERSFEAIGKNQRKLHLKLTTPSHDCVALECDINRRVFFQRKKLLTTTPIHDLSIGDQGAKKLASWMGRHYTRTALPDQLVQNMRQRFLPKLEKILKEITDNGTIFHINIDSIYISYSSSETHNV
jgi:hypothetical protein